MSTTLHPDAAEELRQRLDDIGQQAGIDTQGAKLIKYTMNAVYLAPPYVLRLARGPHAEALAHRAVAIAAGLARVGAPTIRLGDRVSQPLSSGDWVATIWQHVRVIDVEPAPVDLAEPLRILHTLDHLDGVDLPAWSPVEKFRRRIEAAAALPAADIDRWSQAELGIGRDDLLHELRRRCEHLTAALATLAWQLPCGVIHGDAHTGNLLLRQHPQRPNPDPTALLCDLDGVCHGPREWDLLPTAHGATRFGRSTTDYHTFAQRYGFDVTAWSGWPVLRDVRELQLVTSTLDSVATRPEMASQLAHRLRSLLAGDTSATWTRYR